MPIETGPRARDLRECAPTPMPSIALELGKYVTVRPPLSKPPRQDGTRRVYFQVPRRLCPSDWPSLIPLPIAGDRKGDLADAGEVERIQADAARLYRDLQQARLGRPTAPPRRSIQTLVTSWENSSSWKDLKPKSVKHYASYIGHCLTWAETCDPPQPDPTTLTRSDIEGLLGLFDGHPVGKKHVRKTIRLIMEQAIAMGWRKDNPVAGIRLARAAKSKAGIWEQADVDTYVEAAQEHGYHSIATLILMEWEIGQRLGDAMGFRTGLEYDAAAGMFRFWQDKTDSYVSIEVSERLQALLKTIGGNQLFLFRNERTGKAYTDERLSKTFAWVRTAARHKGGRYLQLRWLRHSCVVQLARAGCEIPEIAAITGHSHASVAKMLDVYLPRDSEVAKNAQRKRGLIGDKTVS